LARLRKALPPPGSVVKSKKTERRQRAKETLLRELKETLPPKSA
jgi:hypothetical protein